VSTYKSGLCERCRLLASRRVAGLLGAFLALCSWLGLALAQIGCSPSDAEPRVPGYMPDWNEARSALESALSRWRDAASPPPASFDSPSVKFVDNERNPDRRLRSYQILGQTELENARQFTVRLTFEGEETPQLVRYNVFGRQPVWVFRLEDYERISHWEHKMDEPPAGPGQPP
jgi:hypothetical protein